VPPFQSEAEKYNDREQVDTRRLQDLSEDDFEEDQEEDPELTQLKQ
jgi:hypothetical protein